MNEQEYHNSPELSQSQLKVLSESHRVFYKRFIAKELSFEKTDAMNLGTCLDLAMTDKESYNKLIVKDTKTTKVEGCITKDWKVQIDAIITSLNDYEIELPEFKTGDFYMRFKDIANVCNTQEMIFFEYNNVKCRAKLDYSFISDNIVFGIDLKSTSAKNYDEFYKQFFNLKYYLQASMYSLALKLKYNLDYYPNFYFIAISTITGEIFFIKTSISLLELGMQELNYLLGLYKDLQKTNLWCKDNKPTEIFAPDWLEKKINNYL